jgi:hypothetical protein
MSLTDQQVAAINAVHSFGNDVGRMLDEVASFPDVDMRWLAVARTHLQEGFMFVKRAIARPEGF